MRIDQFYQFIVPLAFLAIWALTSLFNREVQPLPPRPQGRPPGPPGPRPAPGSAPARAGDWRPEPTVRPTPGRPGAPRDNGRSPDADILIIESETGTRRAGGPASPRAAAPSTRRPAKVKGQAAPVSKRAEATGGRPLTGSTKAPPISQPLGLTPLSLPPSPLLTSNTLGAGADELKSRASETEPPTALDLQGFLRSPSRVRESILLKEILDRPVSLRNRPPGRR